MLTLADDARVPVFGYAWLSLFTNFSSCTYVGNGEQTVKGGGTPGNRQMQCRATNKLAEGVFGSVHSMFASGDSL